jgi:spore maturation protein CgeE
MFIYEDTAKIEDFAVTSQKQRKGYGTAILKALTEIALEKNVSVIYLETDEDDTAKEMYKKRGFYKVGELTDLIFKL